MCGGSDEQYEFLLNFIACTVRGKKLRKIIMFHTKERTGKGIILKNLMSRLLGQRMYATNSVEEICKYTQRILKEDYI